MLSHGKLDLSYFFGGAENCVDLLHISVAEITEEIICHEFWRNMFVYLQTHLLMQAIASAPKKEPGKERNLELSPEARW